MALTLDIVTPERRVLSVSCDEVRAPGAEGGFGVRRDHEPFMTALEPGVLTYVEGGREHHYAVGGGFFQVADNRIIVLADTAEAAADIDVERARRAFEDAQNRLLKLTEQDERHAEEAARVRRATARIRVAGG
jgi:F-type H+-transporting ATPase subunit epsilon